jgi:hypothetical protein
VRRTNCREFVRYEGPAIAVYDRASIPLHHEAVSRIQNVNSLCGSLAKFDNR